MVTVQVEKETPTNNSGDKYTENKLQLNLATTNRRVLNRLIKESRKLFNSSMEKRVCIYSLDDRKNLHWETIGYRPIRPP